MNYYTIPSLHNRNTLKQLYLLDITSELVGRKLDPKEHNVIKIICDYYNVSIEDLKGRNRKREIAEARHVTMYALTQWLNISNYLAGNILDRDRNTAIHSTNEVNNLMDVDKKFKEKILNLKELINK